MITHREFFGNLLRAMYQGWAQKLALLGVVLVLATGYLPVDAHSRTGHILQWFSPYRFYFAGLIMLISIYFSAFNLVRSSRLEKAELAKHLHNLEQSLMPALVLAYDDEDPSCIRSWSDAPQHLYRVRVHNPPGGNYVEGIKVKVENIEPLVPDLLGTTLCVRHEGGHVPSVNLGPDQKAYFDFLQFNPKDEKSGSPVLFLWHTVEHVTRELQVRSYRFVLRAYGSQANSGPILLLFTVTDRYNYRLKQLQI